MRIAIVDDDKHWRECAENIVYQHYNNAEIELDIFESGEKYLESKKSYDISFVDIEMPIIDGFTTISKAREYNRDGIYIILTTHLELSRKGFLVNAFRYIDKTNLDEEMAEAIKSAEIILGRNQKIVVNAVGEGQREIILKNIIYIETEKHCILVHTHYGIVRCSNSMNDIEQALNGKWFFRCHNAYMVNLDEIRKVEDKTILMSDGNDIEISRRRFPEFKKSYVNRQYESANA